MSALFAHPPPAHAQFPSHSHAAAPPQPALRDTAPSGLARWPPSLQVKTHPKTDKPLDEVRMLNIEIKATAE